MSERRDDDHYVRRWQVFAIALLILLVWFTDSVKQDSQLRDLQRRIGQLEQQVKQQ